MKNINSMREKLGITQEKLALLLGVSRSQLSLFEIGKRSLPVDAKIKLASLLEQINEKYEEKYTEEDKLLKTEKVKILERLIQNNLMKQYILNKKIKIIDQKHKKLKATENLIQILDQDTKNFYKTTVIQHFLHSKKLQKNKHLPKIYECEVKHELLLEEEKLLKNILERL